MYVKWKARKERRSKRSRRTILSISREVCGPLYPGLSRFLRVGIGNDGRRDNRILQADRGTSCKCPARRKSKTNNHLLLRKRSTCSDKNAFLTHPQISDKSTDSLPLHKWQGSTVELHKPNCFTRIASCLSQPKEEARSIYQWYSGDWWNDL